MPVLNMMVVLLLQAAPATIPADLATELKNIKIETEATEAAGKALTAEGAALQKERKHLEDSDYLLQRGAATFKREFDAWEQDKAALVVDTAAQHAFAAEVNAEVQNHNGRCGGTYDDEAHVNSCNSELPYLEGRAAKVTEWGARVDAWAKRVRERAIGLQQQRRTLEEGYNLLTNGTVDWAKRQKAFNDAADKLEATKQQLKDRMAKAIARLAQTDAMSKDCAEIAKKITPDSCQGKGDPSDPANWNTPCERAARCLQKVWDGAK